MLGLKHEHNRKDRNDYVKVYWNNIDPDEYDNFRKCDDIGVRCEEYGEYDYNSIMHYRNKDFSINRQNTIEKINDPYYVLGSPTPSTKDINTINLFYGCRDTKGTSFKILLISTKF